jgi:nitroreductase
MRGLPARNFGPWAEGKTIFAAKPAPFIKRRASRGGFMQKPATTNYPVHPLIRDRWSPVCFSSRPIDSEILGSLFEAARWAPSSFNDQPWSFCVATQDQPEEFAAMLACLAEANQAWARHAYLLLISVARLASSRTGRPNRHAFHDVGAATMNLILQATSHGLFCHPMAGFDVSKARAVLAVPETHEPLTAMAIGYPADDLSTFDAALRERDHSPRGRKPLSELVFTGSFGNPDRRIG